MSRLLPPREAAQVLGVSVNELYRWRVRRAGPPWSEHTVTGKKRKLIFYTADDLYHFVVSEEKRRVAASGTLARNRKPKPIRTVYLSKMPTTTFPVRRLAKRVDWTKVRVRVEEGVAGKPRGRPPKGRER